MERIIRKNRERREKIEMYRIGITLLTIIFLFNSYVFALPKAGEKVKDFTLNNLQGEKVSLKTFQGKKIIFLNFFATWCPSCREEIPVLTKLYSEYQDKDVEFIGIDLREDKKKVTSFVEKYKINYPVLLDLGGAVGKLYQISFIPFNLLIDQEGIVRFAGSFSTLEELKKELNKIVPKKKPSIPGGRK